MRGGKVADWALGGIVGEIATVAVFGAVGHFTGSFSIVFEFARENLLEFVLWTAFAFCVGSAVGWHVRSVMLRKAIEEIEAEHEAAMESAAAKHAAQVSKLEKEIASKDKLIAEQKTRLEMRKRDFEDAKRAAREAGVMVATMPRELRSATRNLDLTKKDR